MKPTQFEQHFGDRIVRCFSDRPANLNVMRDAAARRRAGAIALVSGDRRLTWAALDRQVMQVAGGLHSLGVRPGDRVALLLGNDIEFVVVAFATLAAGATVVPLSTRDQAPGVAYILRDSGATVLVHEAHLRDRVPSAEAAPGLHRVSVAGTTEGSIAFESLLASEPLAASVAVPEEDLALLMYTSGTTGAPKGAMLTHFNVVHSILHYQQALGLDQNVRGAAVVPLSHVTGLVAVMMVTLCLGGTLVVAGQFKAAEFLPLAERERISFTIMVPAMYKLCLLQEGFNQYDLSSWTVGGFGGSPMPPETIDRLARELPGLRLSNCYGATETASPVTVMPSHLTREHLDSVGPALPCAEIRVMDDQGREVPPGETGELWLQGPMVVKGYWGNPQATRDNIIAGYWRSGDVGRIDAQGFVYVLDRIKDMLNRGGYKIYSVEVENVLCEHPDVLEVAVVAKPCPVLGERVHVFVVPRDGRQPDLEALRSHCAARLSDYKVPESYTVRTEPLPRNANGKVMKRQLREEQLAALLGGAAR
ncbi:MAG: acyl--CoA ligase [Proteobacteria bacterium]|nr:acyl--CoA ligase [Pseudomonadota bacterium]